VLLLLLLLLLLLSPPPTTTGDCCSVCSPAGHVSAVLAAAPSEAQGSGSRPGVPRELQAGESTAQHSSSSM